jgi:hypothetical protein
MKSKNKTKNYIIINHLLDCFNKFNFSQLSDK